MKELLIKSSYIYQWKESVRMAAVISFDGVEKELYFETDKEYEKYFCTEYSDAFVFALIYFCMINGYNVQCETPMSEQLYYQLTTYFIPVVTASDELLHSIQINAEVKSYELERGTAAGASVSGGVDSFYTILKHLNGLEKGHRISHLVFSNIFGAYADEEDTRKKYEQLKEKNTKIASKLHLELLGIYTNIHEFNFKAFPNYFTLRTCAMILALKKLFGIYYYASGYSISDFTVSSKERDSAKYDLLNVHILTDKALFFYSSGGELARTDKTVFIAGNNIVQKYLKVCNIEEGNCSVCSKCQRTLITLWALDRLDSFREVFDIPMFEKNRKKVLVKLISRKNEYDREILNLIKSRNIKLSWITLLEGHVLRPLEYIKGILRKNIMLRRIYYALKLDFLRFGKKQAEFYRFEHTDENGNLV